jgi:hypothetical protein
MLHENKMKWQKIKYEVNMNNSVRWRRFIVPKKVEQINLFTYTSQIK